EHGIEKFIAKSGKMRGDEVTIKLDIPKERKPESTVMTVQVTPSMAVTMLDALPYLIDYPYGCTEQTMSRFLPAVVVAKTLKDLGLRPELVMGKVFGGVEPEFATQTHPHGSKDLQVLDDVTQQSLKRLYDFQHSDGGWGWWKEGSTDPFMTAYIVWGLTLARDTGIKLKPEVLDRGVDYLEKTLVEQETNYDLQAWMLHAVSTYHQSIKLAKIASPVSKAFDNLWKNRDQLNAYTRALLALSGNHLGYTDQARTLIRNLENGVKIDTRPDVSIIQKGGQGSEKNVIPTAHWGEDGIYWRWSDGGVEATSFALRALLAIDPQNKLVEPVTNWLIKNRRGAQWNSTRDTAITILSLTDYLRSSGELRPEVEYELSVNGHMIVTKKVTPDDALTAPSLFPVDAKNLVDGVNEIRIKRKSGSSPLYFYAQARYFSLEEPIPAAGNEIFVRRQYYKLVGHPTLLKGYVYDRQPLNDGDSVTSGDRVQTVLTIEGKNNYEYLVFEDLKPAGLEAVQIRSGEPMYARELKSETIEREASVQSAKFKVQSEGSKVQSATADGGPKSKVDITTAHLSESSYTGRSRWVYQ
ncbi:MAG TPA: alpha-2-macroglobulin, partial [Nitrospirota bacterium]